MLFLIKQLFLSFVCNLTFQLSKLVKFNNKYSLLSLVSGISANIAIPEYTQFFVLHDQAKNRKRSRLLIFIGCILFKA